MDVGVELPETEFFFYAISMPLILMHYIGSSCYPWIWGFLCLRKAHCWHNRVVQGAKSANMGPGFPVSAAKSTTRWGLRQQRFPVPPVLRAGVWDKCGQSGFLLRDNPFQASLPLCSRSQQFLVLSGWTWNSGSATFVTWPPYVFPFL